MVVHSLQGCHCSTGISLPKRADLAKGDALALRLLALLQPLFHGQPFPLPNCLGPCTQRHGFNLRLGQDSGV